MDAFFYHISSEYITELLEHLINKSFEKNWRSLIYFKNEEFLKEVDNKLWELQPPIVHGIDVEEHNHLQPVLLTKNTNNINNSKILFIIEPHDDLDFILESFERVVVVVSDHPQYIAAARNLWKLYKEKNINLYYYKKTSTGQWKKESEFISKEKK